MTAPLVLALLILLLASPLAAGRSDIEPDQPRATVTEANHFYSETETSARYKLANLQMDRPLVFHLKPQEVDSTDNALENNPVTVTLETDSSSVSCVFNRYTNLCALEEVNSDVKLSIECKSAPCSLNWLIVQPTVHEKDGKQAIDNLVPVNKKSKHAIVRAICKNPDLKSTFGQDIHLFSNSKFKKIASKMGMVYFLFDNEQKGHYYITASSEAARNCVNITLIHPEDKIDFEDPKKSTVDFITSQTVNVYDFVSVPTTDFRVECSAHDLMLEPLDNNTGIFMYIAGLKEGDEKMSILNQISLIVDNEKSHFEFSFIFKKPSQSYKFLKFFLRSQDRDLMINMRFVANDLHEIQLGEQSYFELKQGEKVNFKLVPVVKDVKGLRKLFIFGSDNDTFKVSKESCGTRGCEFEVEALKKGMGSIYIGQEQNRNVNEIIITEFNGSVTQKVREGQRVYFSYKTKGKALQLLINSPSVIAYAADRQKCANIADDKCYEKTFNFHNPGIYKSKVDGQVLFRVFALDNCEFTLTVLDSVHIYQQLKDSVPFAYLMDDQQKSIYLHIKLPKAEDISFNLIGPANELILKVLNKDKPKEEDVNSALVSSDGYIHIPKEEFNGLMFIVMVEKRQEFLKKFVHFTIIASTKEGNLRLEPGIAHYETLHPKDRRDYVFEIEDWSVRKSIVLNFYSHNLKSLVDLTVKISKTDNYNDRQQITEFTINQEVDILDIAFISKKLCSNEQGKNCELFVRVQNQMELQVDVTITLIMRHSVIQLKDGLWQSYKAGHATMTSHFFFYPKHIDRSTTIFYKSTLVDMRIMYILWKSDDQSIDVASWPFPATKVEKGSQIQYKPIDFIHIEPNQLKQCWPYCIVLLSLYPDTASFKSELKKMTRDDIQKEEFKIMATNNYVELPEKHKVDVIMVKNQTKELMVNMKYFMQVDELTFQIHRTVGYPKFHISVSSEKNRRCPSADQTADFVFGEFINPFSIPIQDIKKKIADNNMEGHKNINLCILVESRDDAKFSIEFTSDSTAMKTLALDGTYSLKSKGNQTNYYRIDASQEFQLKITRLEGFPYISTKSCPGGNSQPDCINEFQSDSTRGKKQADKVSTFTATPCSGCILLVRVETETPSKLTFHPQSKFTEIELREGVQMSEDLDRSGQHRYTVTGSRIKDITINIQITSGNLRVRATDFGSIDLTETNTPGSKNIHITIPAQNLKKTETQKQVMARSDSFGLSSFVHLHLTVQAQNHLEKASYIISYSNGNVVLSLQDGVITEYKLIKKGHYTFIYENPIITGIYLHASTPDVLSLSNLQVKMYGADDISQGIQEFIPQKPNFRQKTPNPTMLLQLPAKKIYYCTIFNENDRDIMLSIGVNNLETIYLPFQHEFPIQLERTEVVHLVVTTSEPGYVRISFSKCDQSQPYIAYSTNYEDFVKEEYSVEQQMGDELSEDLFIRVKSAGGVYIKLRSPSNDQSLLVIKATFSKTKFNISKSKAGEQGMIQYQRLDSSKAELSLASLVCSAEDKNCSRDFSYSAISSHSMDSVYAQLVCPSVMFDLVRVQHILSSDSIPISSSSIRNGRVTFTHQISGDVSYIGVKAINSRTGEIVYYRPIEISTLWGEMNRNSKLTIILRFSGIVLVIGGLILAWKKWKGRKQYNEIGFFNESYE